MSIVSKDGYFRKAEYAGNKAYENREIALSKGMTDEQCDMLDMLCKERHNLHCNWDLAFNSQSTYSWDWYGDGDRSLNDKLRNIGLEEIDNLPKDIEIITDFDWHELKLYDNYEDAMDAACNQYADINNNIEDYLQKIDLKYGTEYCPTGMTRV